MLGSVNTLSLCSTCKHAQQCTLKCKGEKPVFYCEEFDFDRPIAMNIVNPFQVHPRPAKTNGKTQYVGLCSDCEDRHECGSAKTEGGIWHCQEYR